MDFHGILMKGNFETNNIKSLDDIEVIDIDDLTGKHTFKTDIKITGFTTPSGSENEYVLQSDNNLGDCSFSYRSIPLGSKVLFETDSTVIGYTLLTNFDDAVVYIQRGSAAGGGNEEGGIERPSSTWDIGTQLTHTHSISIESSHNHSTSNISVSESQLPNHSHFFSSLTDSGVNVNILWRTDTGVKSEYELRGDYYGYTTRCGISASTGSGGGHNHGNVNPAGAHNHGGNTAGTSFGSSWRPYGRNYTRQQKT